MEPVKVDVIITIGRASTGAELLATLAYLHYDKEGPGIYLNRILEDEINGKSRNVLSGVEIMADDPAFTSTPQAKVERKIKFGENPSIDDVKYVFTTLYGDEERGRHHIQQMTLGLVDHGYFAGARIEPNLHNETVVGTDEEIAEEIAQLTEEFYITNEQLMIE